MNYRLEQRDGYLLAELAGRESAADMRAFLTAVKSACLEHGQPRILMSVRDSRAVFKAEDYGLSGYANDMVTPSCRIALVGDSSELHHAHEYIVLVARQQNVNVRAFRDVPSASGWLASGVVPAPVAASDFLEPVGAPKLT